MENTTPSDAIDTDLLARVKALGTYDPDGGDEDHDRAYTRPCNITSVDLGDTWITIHASQHGIEDAVLYPLHGPLVEFSAETADAILDALDASNFPCHPE